MDILPPPCIIIALVQGKKAGLSPKRDEFVTSLLQQWFRYRGDERVGRWSPRQWEVAESIARQLIAEGKATGNED